jgi:hypothetical protein
MGDDCSGRRHEAALDASSCASQPPRATCTLYYCQRLLKLKLRSAVMIIRPGELAFVLEHWFLFLCLCHGSFLRSYLQSFAFHAETPCVRWKNTSVGLY